MAAGMLTDLFRSPEKDLLAAQNTDDTQAAQLAQAGPFAAAAQTMYEGARTTGRGLGTALVSAAGADPRTLPQRNAAAVEAAKKQVAQLGFNPDDPKSIDEFYKRVIMILQQQGLAPEALDVAKEWHKQKNEDALTQAKTDEVARKKARDVAGDARAQERNRILEKKGALGAETVQLLNMLDNVDPLEPEGQAKRAAITARLNALAQGKGVKFVNLGDRVALVDPTTNQEIGSLEKGAAPMSEKDNAKADQQSAMAQTKYDQTKLSLQTNYASAAELYNMPGLREAIGVVAGLISKGTINQQGSNWFDTLNRARLSASAKAAVAKIAQVQGQTFIAALVDLKSSSDRGSTGLGSLTEVEGAKIQNAKAALDPQQPYESYRANLAQYMHQLELSSQVIDQGAQSLQLKVKPLNTAAGGATAAPAAPAAATPAASTSPAPVAPAAPQGDRVRVRMPDGQIGTIPRAKLEAAKAQGATEVQ